ncbi:hypothetical protein LR48_Vigan07g138000 [Vigna angularis]|uniref:U-box domain-containing protein n=1 Tax=Phaseolus angularis TaxID=3914 RepID=A0A0L9UYA5_PHAAN|nr:hypothetical protein LR48_Vigan07g138000 [Vigna angularis]
MSNPSLSVTALAPSPLHTMEVQIKSQLSWDEIPSQNRESQSQRQRRTSLTSLRPSVISPHVAATSPASCNALRHLRRVATPCDTLITGMRVEEQYIWRSGAGALHGFPAEGELLHGDYREHFAKDLQSAVKICIDGLQSQSVAVKRSAAAKLRLVAKNRADNRILIAESGVVPVLVPLLCCSDPWTQERAVIVLLNLSLHEDNKMLITNAGAVKSLIYVLKTGTKTSKQNATCALLSLALVEENKSSIRASGAIPPLVSLLLNGSSRGKKDALTTLYKLCSVRRRRSRSNNRR